MQSTSGWFASSQSVTRGMRAVSEFTFQVARRISLHLHPSTITKSRSASQAVWPSTVALPWPFPARAESRSIDTSSSSVSPGTTWRRKRARSIPPNRGSLPA